MKPWPFKSDTHNYTLYGVVIGVVFVIIVYSLDSYGSAQQIIELPLFQITNPVLWIIVSTPLWLGLLGRLVGTQKTQLTQKIVQMDQIITRGSQDLELAIAEAKMLYQGQLEREEYFRAVVNHTPIIIFATDHQGDFTLSEGKGLETLGRKPGEVVGRSIADIYRETPIILDAIQGALQ
ncbi:MAG: PAS domain-containing protein, partial [Chloroflexota bacterium]